MKKCVIIGSGLGGLSTAVILAKNGYQVTVLEQGHQIGGCLQCFRRGDALFDTGMHYIGSADPGQTLHTILRYLGIHDHIHLSRLNPSGYDIVSLNGDHYRFANGKEPFVETLAQHFPQSRDELHRYYDLIQSVATSSAMHSLNREVDLDINAEYQTRSVNEVIAHTVSNPLLRQVLAGIQPLYAGEKDRTPFSTHALITDFYNKSAFRIVGGSSTVADALATVIRENGGKIVTDCKAVKIECDDTHATAVISENQSPCNEREGQRYPADLIISAIHPAATLDLIDSHLLRPAYIRRIRNARNTISAFTVYLQFRKDSVPYMNHNLYLYTTSNTWDALGYNQHSTPNTQRPKVALYMHFCHADQPAYAHTAEIITYMSINEVQRWANTTPFHRGQDYEIFKRQMAERLIDLVQQEYPHLRENIAHYYTSTPLTYLHYTRIPDGAMYGIAKDVNALGGGSISPRTRIPNLLLTGQSTASHGMLGTLAGSLLTCAEILTTDEIFAQLKKHS